MRTPLFCLIQTLLLLLALSACSPQPTRPEQTGERPATDSVASTIERLLQEAGASPSPIREQKQLQASQLLIAEQQYELAQKLLASMPHHQLSPPLYAQHHLLLGRLLSQQGQQHDALSLLEEPRLQQYMDNLDPELQLRLSELRAAILARLGSHLASAQQRIYIDPLLPAARQTLNRQAIWHSLTMLSTAELSRYLPTAFGEDYIAWLQLALIAKQNQTDLDEQLRQLQQWQQRWPRHPASLQPPAELALIQQLAAQRPKHVTLLLPLSGKLAPYGKAIRDGFIASRYQAQQRGSEVPELAIVDSESQPDFIALYRQLSLQGTELIIGPLDKNRVRLLFDEVELAVPTLALNRVDDYGQAPEQLFQFGLSPLDEARQLAELAALAQHRNALLISPSGRWADQVNQAFTSQWQQLGGEVVAESRYSGQQDYSPAIKQALLLKDSEQRAKRLQALLQDKIEFLPRRRADIDMIFLLAKPHQARSIIPLLAYHYAGDLPVYATSRAFAGSRTQRDRDLEGMYFTDMPWLLAADNTLRALTDEELRPGNSTQLRMIGLGADSYQLYPRLNQLQALPNSQVFGQTGTLTLNAQRQIERRLMFARIKQGRAKTIPVATRQPMSDKDDDSYAIPTTY